jgi:alpha-tubulin suppressor-like RCC1 family protein
MDHDEWERTRRAQKGESLEDAMRRTVDSMYEGITSEDFFGSSADEEAKEESKPLSPEESARLAKEYDNKRNKNNYEYALSELNEAKSKINTAQTSMEFAQLSERFSEITRILKSLPGSFNVNSPIKECETLLKQINQKDQELIKKSGDILPQIRERIAKFQGCISVGKQETGGNRAIGLKADGTVATERDRKGDNTQYWWNITAVSAGNNHFVGLKMDGTIVACGFNVYGECNIQSWQNIKAVSAGKEYTVGLKADGTVITVGKNIKTYRNTQGWQNIVAVSAGENHIIGLKADGTVVAVGDNYDGQCNTQGWQDIIAVSAGKNHTVGLKTDGTVVAVGDNNYYNIQSWRDIVAISAGNNHTVGLKADGTVIASGFNVHGKCDTQYWSNIVAISAGDDITIGLTEDGTVNVVGDMLFSKDLDTINQWQNIRPISEELCIKWKRQAGICRYCGGKISGLFTKKCKSCGKKN